MPDAHSSCGVRSASAATTTYVARTSELSPVRLSVTTTPAALPSSTSTRVTSDSSKSVNCGLSRVTSPSTTSDPDQTRLPSSRRCTASGIRCTRAVAMRPASSAAARRSRTSGAYGELSKASVVTPSSRSASESSSSKLPSASRIAIRSLPPGRGHAPVQCAAIPPTLLDMAATGRPSSPSTW